jgi:tyrosine-protein phosphatase SIW14
MHSRRRALRLHTVVLSLTVSLQAAPALAGSRAQTSSVSNAAAAIHIDNFGQITKTYYRGAQPKGGDFQALARLGIKTVIDLAEEGDRGEEANANAAGMKFVRIPMTTHAVPSPMVVAQFMSLVTDPANQPVYVHCIGGRHRTGVMTAIYRMTMDGWNAARAFDEMKKFKFGAPFLHPEFKAFIDSYVAPSPGVRPRQ